MSCTAADLVNIQPLVLSDTFNTWFDRTNEVIAAANAINIYDVDVGTTSGGLVIDTGCSAGYYNGVAVISVNPGAGIGIGAEGFDGNFNKVVIDAVRLEDLGTGSTANPAVGDYIIVGDISDTRQGSAGTPKRTVASRMLPPAVYFGDAGDGSFEIYGDVTIHGNINIEGDQSFIDSNDLRIEDKIIELAYNRYAEFTVEKTSMDAGSIEVGATAYYIDPGSATLTANSTTIGYIRSFSYSGSATGSVQMHAFDEGGVTDIVNGGTLFVDGASLTFDVVSVPVIDTAFYNDTLLTPAGIDIKGASGDKTFLWNLKTPDTLLTWNAFVANTNLGVTGAENYIISSKFASYGYDASTDDTFTFYGAGDSFTKATVGTEFLIHHSATGEAGITFAQVYSGSTGPAVYDGVTVTDWAKYLNADQLDGAHSLTTATAWSIPVALSDGRIHEDWVRADAIRKTFSATGHSFMKGDIVRFDSDGSLTFARADTVPTAEAIGMVEVASGSVLTVVTKGFISGLVGDRIDALKPLVTGNAYYLSQSVGGGMIENPDSGAYEISAGQVRKAMFLATGIDSGYVVNYTGTVVGSDPTDLIYLSRVAPVGSVHPFAGLTSAIPDGWLLCDGAAVAQNAQADLFAAIGNTYFADAEVYDLSTLVVDADTRGIAVGDSIRVVWATGAANLVVSSVNTSTRRVSFGAEEPFTDLPEGTDLRIYGRTVPSTVGRSVFFLPDLRRRTVIGTSFGSGLAGSGNLTPSLALGNVGGSHEVTLASDNIPPHTHALDTTVRSDTSGIYGSSSTQTGGLLGLGEDPTAFGILPPHVVMHYIIRAKRGVSATIITGHNHDDHYIRYNIPHTTASGAGRTLIDSDRVQFRANAHVLRNDGDDVFRGTLEITGSLRVEDDLSVTGSVSVVEDLSVGDALTVGGVSRFDAAMKVTGGSVTIVNASGAKEWSNYSPLNGGSAQWNDASLRIVGGTTRKASINLFNNNSLFADSDDGYKDQGRINFYGVAVTGSNEPPQYTGSLGYSLYGPNMEASDGNVLSAGQYEYRVGFNIAGKSDPSTYVDETALLISRRSGVGVGNGSINYRLPKLLPSSTVGTLYRPVVMDTEGQLFRGNIGDNSANGWAVLPGNRILIQWGSVEFSGTENDGTQSVDWPHSFSAAPYSVTVTAKNPSNSTSFVGDKFGQVGSLDSESATLILQGIQNSGEINGWKLFWTAIGPA